MPLKSGRRSPGRGSEAAGAFGGAARGGGAWRPQGEAGDLVAEVHADGQRQRERRGLGELGEGAGGVVLGESEEPEVRGGAGQEGPDRGCDVGQHGGVPVAGHELPEEPDESGRGGGGGDLVGAGPLVQHAEEGPGDPAVESGEQQHPALALQQHREGEGHHHRGGQLHPGRSPARSA